jgi:N6-adenosine-specific RNA methylase IME4
MVPIEVDEDGTILDGQHRKAIADRLGLACPRIVRTGMSEAAKRDHALKLNLLRRHLGPMAWATVFRALAVERGVRLGSGKGDPSGKAAKMAALAAEFGVSARTARRRLADAAFVDRYAPQLVAAVDAGEVSMSRVREVARRRRIEDIAAVIRADARDLPTGPFRVIVADPPWRFDQAVDRPGRRGRVPYPTMSVDEIKALAVASIADQDAVLWLWATNAHLEAAHAVARQWGFEPKTILTWVKDRPGVGHWLRGQTEHCILAVRGHPVIETSTQSTALMAAVRGHSAKPDEFYRLVESSCPGAKVDLFARRARKGWAVWGGEVQPDLSWPVDRTGGRDRVVDEVEPHKRRTRNARPAAA